MERLVKGLSGMMIAVIGMLIITQTAGAQDNADTLIQASTTEPAAIVAMAPAADNQIMEALQQTNTLEPKSFADPMQQAQGKAKNFEEAGNAFGIVLSALAMAGLFLMAML